MTRERGFTIIAVIVAIIVLTVGLLGLLTSAAQYAARRRAMLRASGCRSQAGARNHCSAVASRRGRFVNRGHHHWQVVVRSKY